jgi:ATP-dependent helicase/nuclease subunit A
MDIYFDSPEGLVLIDYKTDRITGSDGIQQLKNRYSTQLLLYGEALSKLTGRPVASAWIYSSYQGQWVEIQLIPQLKEATF